LRQRYHFGNKSNESMRPGIMIIADQTSISKGGLPSPGQIISGLVLRCRLFWSDFYDTKIQSRGYSYREIVSIVSALFETKIRETKKDYH
jgi:hypothetical protein